MSSTATIAEIAARAGVGTATVDRVLNKRPGVNADTVQRVLQVVRLLIGLGPAQAHHLGQQPLAERVPAKRALSGCAASLGELQVAGGLVD